MDRKLWLKGALIALLIVLLPALAADSEAMENRPRFFPASHGADVPVLNYHMVDEDQIALSIGPADFEAQMRYLKEHHYHSITPDQLMDSLRRGAPLPEKPILITFDDGYADNYTKAYPIMQKYGFTAVIFVVTGLVNRDSRFLTWDQIREMQRRGFVFGSHTMRHRSLTSLTPAQARAELVGSKRKLERELGRPVRYFAYPMGTYNIQLMRLLEECGYQAAFTIQYGRVDAESNPYAMERIPLFRSGGGGARTFESFRRRVCYSSLLERLGLIR